MKKTITYFLALSFVLFLANQAGAQMLVESFDNFPFTEDVFDTAASVNGAGGSISLNAVLPVEAIEGEGAAGIEYNIESTNDWGGYVSHRFSLADEGLWDWSDYSFLSLYYNSIVSQSLPGRGHFRIQLLDASDTTANITESDDLESWYSFNYVLDSGAGWNQLVIPLTDVGSAAQTGSNGFWQTLWAGRPGNNTLDLDKIKGIIFEFSVSGPNDGEIISGEILIDQLEVLIEAPSSITERKYQNLSVFPNPASNEISFDNSLHLSNMRVVNMAGQLVQQLKEVSGSINVSKLNPGIYYITAEDLNGALYQQKLVID